MLVNILYSKRINSIILHLCFTFGLFDRKGVDTLLLAGEGTLKSDPATLRRVGQIGPSNLTILIKIV